MINGYVREYKIGSGSYGKVVSIVFAELSFLYSHGIHCPEPFLDTHRRLFIEVVLMESIMQLR